MKLVREIQQIEIPPPPPPPVQFEEQEQFVLTMTRKEFEALIAVAGNVAGPPETSTAWRFFNNVWYAGQREGIFYADVKHLLNKGEANRFCFLADKKEAPTPTPTSPSPDFVGVLTYNFGTNA